MREIPGASNGHEGAYVPLHMQSRFSLLRGTASIERLVERLRVLGFNRAALVDRDNLYGAIFFREAARAAGIVSITGAEVSDLPGEGREIAGGGVVGGEAARSVSPDRAVLLARDAVGYGNVCRVVSARHLEATFDLAGSVRTDARGLFVLVESTRLAEALREGVEPGALWIEIPPSIGPRSFAHRKETARRLGIGMVVGGAICTAGPEERSFEALLAAIRTNTLVGREVRAKGEAFGDRLRSPGEVARLLRGSPELIADGRAIAEACDFDPVRTEPIFPKCPLPPGETAYSYLHRLAQEGLRRRYGKGITPEITARLQRELETVHGSGFSEYFVVVGDLVRFARSRGIPVVGRGSGAGSLLAYLLGITSVDPIAHRLYFERFLNSLRDDRPDLDVDLCWRGRDEVIDYAYERYGRDRVAMISTHNHYHCRSAFRDTARAFGLPAGVVDRVSRRIPREIDGTLDEYFARSRALREYPRDRKAYTAVLRLAERLRGAPRHLGIHCGGIVIGDRPLDRLTGLERAAKGIVITQYEMESIERIGLIKIDLLGNRAISTIRETTSLIRKARGEEIDMETIPDDDGPTARLLREGRTLGCFQIESPGMRTLLRMIGTSDMEGTIAAHSLIRPGPASSGMKERFVRRIRGLEPVSYPHPDLEDLLAETLGVPLYQEDVMAVASRITGLSLEESDLLRRRIAEAGDDRSMRALTNTFLALAVQRGVELPLAKEVWRMIARFANYAFCKAHAAGYGVLAYRTAYLKANYPAEHAVALLNNHQGMYATRVHLEEARRRGIEIRPPCVQRSADRFTLEFDDAPASAIGRSGPGRPTGAIRTGLAQVRDLSVPVRRRIYEGRPFRSFAHFLRRVRPPRRDAERLVLVGGG